MADVCIIGYGPVGATLACLLDACGISVAILEREPAAYPLPRALHFDDEVMRVFQATGIAASLLPLTRVSPGMQFVAADGRLLLDWSRPPGIGPQGWNASYRFHQPDLERLLRTEVATRPGIVVQLGTDVTGVTQGRDGAAVATLHRATGHPGQVHARFVVGCDGARSLVRGAIGAPLDDLGFHERWIVVDAILRRPAPHLGDISLQHCNPARPATYVRGVGDRRRWEIALHPDEDAAAMTRPDRVYRLLSPWITPEDATIERAVCYTFTSAIASRWRDARLLIAGDAAHQMPPFLGQGMCAGIRDAANLAWKLARVCRGHAPDTLLDTYQSERAPHVREYIALAVRLGGLINTTDPATALAGMQAQAGGPARMTSLKPALGPGLSAGDPALAGAVVPQPRLADGALLDDRAGYRFALLHRAGVPLPRGIQGACARAAIAVIDDPAVQDWLHQAGAAAAMIRPDRHVLGMARPGAMMEHDLADLIATAAPSLHEPIAKAG